MRARVTAMVLGAALVAGCGHPHPAPDPRLVGDLQAAIGATTTAMGKPLAPQDAVEQAQQLAWACDPERIRAIRAGALGATQVVDEARAIARRIARPGSGAHPPEVLTWLAAKDRVLGIRDTELLDAVRAQAALELKGAAR